MAHVSPESRPHASNRPSRNSGCRRASRAAVVRPESPRSQNKQTNKASQMTDKQSNCENLPGSQHSGMWHDLEWENENDGRREREIEVMEMVWRVETDVDVNWRGFDGTQPASLQTRPSRSERKSLVVWVWNIPQTYPRTTKPAQTQTPYTLTRSRT